MTVGERIRIIRKSQDMNQSEFAKEIAISTTSVCQLETGRYNISRMTKKLLCSRFHVNPLWLDTGEGEIYVTAETAEEIIPDLIEILNSNKFLLNAVKQTTKMLTVDDWKKLNALIATIGGNNE